MGYFRAGLTLLVAATSAAARAQEAAPEAAAGKFVALANADMLAGPEGQRLLSGELERFDSSGFGVALPAPDRFAQAAGGNVVARIPASGPIPDLYLTLSAGEGGWTVSALRTLATTGPIEELAHLLALKPDRSAEEERMLRNARLTLAPDRDLIAWSRTHRALLERARAAPDSPAVRAALVEAGALHAAADGPVTRVTIGGLVDNEVGFLFAADGVPPPVDGRSIIWTEDAGGGWFLYKTT